MSEWVSEYGPFCGAYVSVFCVYVKVNVKIGCGSSYVWLCGVCVCACESC